MKNEKTLKLNSSNINESYNNLPVLFDKKTKKIQVVKPLTHILNDTGKTRHFTPAAQEWFNSIYNYNPNYTKSLPVADIGLMRLLKAYFASQLKQTLVKTKRLPTRFRRQSTKKIFVGKGEIKHSNDKAIVTFYVHNAEKLFLDRAIFLLDRALYEPARPLRKYTHINKNKQVKITYNRILSFKEYWNLIGKNSYYKKWSSNHFMQNLDFVNLVLKNLNLQYYILNTLFKLNIISEKDKNITFTSLCENIVPVLPDPQFNEIKPLYEKHYIMRLSNFKLLKLLNVNKFRFGFINKLIKLVEKIYAKKVEFNIVKLKKLHFNSDLYTQAVALKLKNRKNKLYRVLKSSLNKVSLPEFFRAGEIDHHINKKDIFVNNIRNDNINSMFKTNVHDPLNTLLLDTFGNSNNRENTDKLASIKPRDISLEEHVLKSLKHTNMRGIRIEAKGRATRRLTAARSVFKMKWKGGLKNIDSSFNRLSAILLRGHMKSNVQYTYIGTKNRNGAIGVKGWVSSR